MRIRRFRDETKKERNKGEEREVCPLVATCLPHLCRPHNFVSIYRMSGAIHAILCVKVEDVNLNTMTPFCKLPSEKI